VTIIAAEAAVRRNSLRLLVGIFGLQFFQSWPINVAPLLNGSLIDSIGLTVAQAGLVATSELVAFAFALIFAARLVDLLSLRTIGLIGLGLAASANLASIGQTVFPVLCAVRGLAGLGGGIAVMAGTAALASAYRVDRVAALQFAMIALVIAFALVGASELSARFGAAGLFQLCALVCGIASAFVAFLPGDTGHSSEEPALRLGLLATVSSPIVIASTASLAGSTAVWAFAERVGLSVGLTVQQVGFALAVTALPGILGGIAAFVVTRPGRELTLTIVGVSCFGASAVLVALAQTPFAFVLGLIVLTFFFVFTQPFITALAIAADRSGRLAAAMLGWTALGSAAAPALAGQVIASQSLASVAWIPAITTVIALACLVWLEQSGRMRTG
jgi:predicted MFS family arabinose efflux permease